MRNSHGNRFFKTGSDNIKNSPAVRAAGLFGFRMNVYGQSFFTGPKMSSLYASMYSTQKKSSPIRASVA